MEILKRIISSIILIPICIYLIIEGSLFFNIFIIVCFLIAIYEWINLTEKSNYKIFGIFFIVLSFYSFYKIRNQFAADYINVLFILISCISTDIGGFVFGKIFKGPKLSKISPNKTYSGSVGGYLFAMFSIYIFSVLPNALINLKFTSEVILYTFLISTMSQLGDLSISYFKRKSKLKDTGKIIPGHGGILDRIDGMLFAFPFCYVLLSLNMINILK